MIKIPCPLFRFMGWGKKRNEEGGGWHLNSPHLLWVLITSRKLVGRKRDLDGTLVIDTVVFSQRCLADV